MTIDPVLYLIMRNDMESLNPGKLAAQAAHAANAFVWDYQIQANHMAPEWPLRSMYETWSKSTKQGFGTTICLGANLSWFNAMRRIPDLSVYGTMSDPSYPQTISAELAEFIKRFAPKNITMNSKGALLLRDELVGAYLFGDKNDPAIQEFLTGLLLYP